MNRPNHRSSATLALIVAASVAAGCVGYVDHPPGQTYYVPPARGPLVEVGFDAPPEDYVYYPAYQVYYGNRGHQFVYREGRRWVSRPTPPRVSAGVVLSAPSVRLDFHDSPANHHAGIVRQYPRRWAPPGGLRGPAPAPSRNDPGRGGRSGEHRN